jgi:hypothetical protein
MRNVEPAQSQAVSIASIDELETVTGGCAVGGCCTGGCATTGGGYSYRQSSGGGFDPLLMLVMMQMFNKK